MLPAESLDFLNMVETRFPVEAWAMYDIRVWPILRMNIGYGTQIDDSMPVSTAPSGSRITTARRMIRTGATWATTRISKRQLSSPSEHADVALLGDGVSRVTLDGRSYDRLCDPLAEIAESLGFSTRRFEPGDGSRLRLTRPAHPVQAAIDASTVIAKGAARGQVGHLDGYGDFLEEAARAGARVGGLTPRALAQQALTTRLLARYFKRILDRCGARVGFLVDRNIASMGFILACHELGISSVEIQHGLQGDTHWAYARWLKVPPAGYELVPRRFWCWTNDDAEVIRAWSDGTVHEPVVGGNPWLQRWVDGTGQAEKAERSSLRRSLRLDERQLVVLITSQRGLVGEGIAMAEAATSIPGTRCLVRLHPTMTPAEQVEMTAGLERVGISAEDVRAASEALLYPLLKETHVHVTHSSATALEAAAFGVPSVITGARYMDEYPPDLREGWLVPGFRDCASAIQDAARRPRVPRTAGPTLEGAMTAFRRLMPGTPGSGERSK